MALPTQVSDVSRGIPTAACLIIPPYMLRHIQEHGDPHEAACARRSLLLTESLRASRAVTSPPAASATGPTGSALVRIYDAAGGTALPGRLVRDDGDPPIGDAAVDEAHEGLQATLDLYSEEFDRNSLDDNGMDLIASVHYGRNYDNAAWTGTQMIFGDGDGTLFNRFTIAIDVMGHELTHGMTQLTAALEYQDQAGALNEHMSDVFGAMVRQFHASPQQTSAQADWLIGAGLFAPGVNGVALRSMKAPGTAYDDPRLGRDPQPDSMSGYVQTSDDNGGVHINSGIPNRAFTRAATDLSGYSWDRAGQVWYATLLDSALTSTATFVDFAELTLTNAARLFDEEVRTVVENAWRTVGVLPG
jgi:Zn-dependent metalloprotease